MTPTLLLEIVTPQRQVLSRPVASVGAAGADGDFCVLPRHIPFLTTLRVGCLSYRLDGALHYAYVGGGFAEVTGERVLVLAEVAELPEEIDVARAMKAKERAQARLDALHREQVNDIRARAALQRAISRLRIHQDAGLAGSMAALGRHNR